MSTNPLHQFQIEPIEHVSLGGVNVDFTNSSLFMLFAFVGVCIFLIAGMRKKAMVPGRWQAMSEMTYMFVANLIKDNIGEEGKKYFPLIFTIFIFILFCNLLGMLPYSFTVTSHIAVTFTLAMLVFLTVLIVGIAKHGFHFIHLFIPSGVPGWMVPIIIPIEMISFLARPLSLSVRLAAAMTAGHVLLKVVAGFIVMLIAGLGLGLGLAAGTLPLGMLVLLIGLEVFICFLQAYIFSLMASIYLNDAIHLH